jgi:hypothetical protein
LPELPIETRIVVGIHAALEDHGVSGAIKELRSNAQRGDLIIAINACWICCDLDFTAPVPLRLMPARR